MLKVIGRERIVLRRQRRAILVRELLGVQLHAQAIGGRCGEHIAGLFRREPNVLAKRIHRIRSAGSGHGRDHHIGDQLHVRRAIVFELGRQCVQTKKRTLHAHALVFANRLRNRQHLQFSLEIESVAGLDLNRGHAVGSQ
jgi:hypothetical protein